MARRAITGAAALTTNALDVVVQGAIHHRIADRCLVGFPATARMQERDARHG